MNEFEVGDIVKYWGEKFQVIALHKSLAWIEDLASDRTAIVHILALDFIPTVGSEIRYSGDPDNWYTIIAELDDKFWIRRNLDSWDTVVSEMSLS